MKTLLNKITCGVFTCSLLVLISSGCEDEMPSDPSPEINIQDYLLYATFEGDDIGSAPDKSLPFHPPGDELQYSSRHDFEVVDVGSSKAVSLAEGGAPISFISRPTNFSGGTVSVRWAANMMNHGNTLFGTHGYKSFLITTNSSAEDDTLVKLRFAGQAMDVYAQSSISNNNPGGSFKQWAVSTNKPGTLIEDVGYTYDLDCQFVVDLHYASKTFDLTIVLLDGGSARLLYTSEVHQGPVIKIEGLPFYDETPATTYTDPARPTLHATDLTSYLGPAPCIMDFVTIIKKPYPRIVEPLWSGR
jgi:hypothetical protein